MRNTTCTNTNEFGESCSRPRAEGSPVSLCQLHLLVAAEHAGAVEVPKIPTIRNVSSRPLNSGGGRPLFRAFEPSVVYYIQEGARIKIGTSTNLPQRLKSISHDQLLAVEPGGLKEERSRHKMFAAIAVGNEWFEAAPPLLAHVRSIRSEHGEPHSVWNKIVAETTRPNRT